MKKFLLKTFGIIVCLLCCTTVFAQTFDANGIYYDITSDTDRTVEVSDVNSWMYTGTTLAIPETVTYNDVTYRVTSIGSGAFLSTGLKFVTIGNNITTIEEKAFYNCTSLLPVTMGESVSSIGYQAFDNTPLYNNQPDGLIYLGKVLYQYKGYMPENTSVVIKEGTKSITDYAFQYTTGLTEVTIPESVALVGKNAFYICSNLTKVVWNAIDCKTPPVEGNTIYPPFYNCSSVNEFILGNKVKTIPTALCIELDKLTSVTIPNSVTSIGEYAFYGCTGLTSIDIPNSVTSIGEDAFYNCSGLTSIDIPNSVTSIGEGAFYGCTGLTSITIPNSVTSIADYAFADCSELTTVDISNNITLLGIDVFNNTPFYNNLPDGLIYFGKVLYKYKGAMPENNSIVIDDGIVSICGKAFYQISNLASVTIPESVTSIGANAFYGCALNQIYCNAITPPAVQDNTFSNYSAGLYIPVNSVESYKNAAYWSNFTNVNKYLVDNIYYNILSETEAEVTYLSLGGYSGDIVIPESVTIADATYNVTSIGNDAFANSTQLTSLVIPNSVTSIGDNVFANCTSLTTIDISENLTSVGADIFYNTPFYNNLPDGLIYLGKVLYQYKGTMPENTSIVIDEGVVSICANALSGFSNLISVTIPESVTTIGDYAFSSCTGLTTVTIPDNVISIGNYAFNSCSGLTSIVIGENVASIGKNAFYCKGLKEIHCKAIAPPTIQSNTFRYFTANLYVPIGSVETYKAATYWSKFTNVNKYLVDGIYYTILSDTEVELIGLDYNSSHNYSIVIPDNITIEGKTYNVTSIGNNAFEYGYFDSITLPNSIISIGNYAFSNCYGLSSVSLPNCTTIGDNAFSGAEIASISIPNCITIGNQAFYNCRSLKSIEFADGLTTIGDYAFYLTKLTSLFIPESVVSIGDYAFSISQLVEINCDAITPPTIYSNTFHNVDKSITLFVPIEGYEDYKTADYWSEFTNVIPLSPVPADILGTYNATANSAFKDYPDESWQVNITADENNNNIVWIQPICAVSNLAVENIQPVYALYNAADNSLIMPLGQVLCYIPNQYESITAITTDAGSTATITGHIEMKISRGIGSLKISFASDYVFGVVDYYYGGWYQALRNINFTKSIPFDNVIYDNATEFLVVEELYCEELTYIRTFDDTEWQPWYMPFEVNYEDLSEEYEVAYLNNIHQYDYDDDGEIDSTELEAFRVTSGVLKANYPYLVKAKTMGEKEIYFSDVTLLPVETNSYECSSMSHRYLFVGTYKSMPTDEMSANDYYTMQSGILEPQGSDGESFNAFRWYLQIESKNSQTKPQAVYIRVDNDTPTGLDSVADTNDDAPEYYDLSGRRVARPEKGSGIYIMKQGSTVRKVVL